MRIESALERRIHNAKEVYIGMEGIIPQTAVESYLLSTLKQMYEELIDQPTPLPKLERLNPPGSIRPYSTGKVTGLDIINMIRPAEQVINQLIDHVEQLTARLDRMEASNGNN